MKPREENNKRIVVLRDGDHSKAAIEAMLITLGDVEIITVEEAIEKGIPIPRETTEFKIKPIDRLPEIFIDPDPLRNKGKGKDRMQWRGKKRKR